MAFPTEWLTVFVIGWFAVMSPGPDFAIVLRNSLGYSRRAGLFTALGIGGGLCIHTLWALVGVGVIIAGSEILFGLVKWLGAAYLVFVGLQALRAGKAGPEAARAASHRTMGAWRAARVGFLTNVLNPKVTLFFLALFTQVVRPDTPSAVQALYGGTIVAISLLWFSTVALVVTHRSVHARFAAVRHWVERAAGVAFIGLGLRLAFARLG